MSVTCVLLLSTWFLPPPDDNPSTKDAAKQRKTNNSDEWEGSCHKSKAVQQGSYARDTGQINRTVADDQSQECTNNGTNARHAYSYRAQYCADEQKLYTRTHGDIWQCGSSIWRTTPIQKNGKHVKTADHTNAGKDCECACSDHKRRALS